VLLDVDGTLIDSNDAHAQAWADAFREFDYDIAVERVRPLVGMGGDKLLPKLTGLDHESELARRMTARRAEVFATRYLPTLHPFPRARELLARFRRDNLMLAIATSSGADQLNDMLEQTGLDELVDRTTTSSDAEHSKPSPDIIEAALAKLHLRAAEALMLGDTPYDVEAARRAGVGTVAVRSGGWPDRALAGAVAIYDDVSHLLREYSTSPFGTG
jgi:HAD superfamily hydrolase (TIGR01509 family)